MPEAQKLSVLLSRQRIVAFKIGHYTAHPKWTKFEYQEVAGAQLKKCLSQASVPTPTLAAELPGLTLRSDIAAGLAAKIIFRNWIGFLANETKAVQVAAQRK